MTSAALVRGLRSAHCLRHRAPACRHALRQVTHATASQQHAAHTASPDHASTTASASAPRSAYVHLPFCKRKCHYCDFPVHAVGKNPGTPHVQQQMQQYVDAVCAEIRACGSAGGPAAALDTVFFGGGTPSLVPPELLQQILLTLRAQYGINPDAEISIEADPGTFDQARLEAYIALGVSRISVGVQSFHQELLEACGRSHSLAEVQEALEAVRKCGVRSWSLDLISGLPTLDMKRWEETLHMAVKAGPHHVSVYDLQVEEGTPFARWYEQGRLSFPRDDDAADMYGKAVQVLTSAGYEHYEVSNYAKPGHRSRHNQAYWKGVPYLAFGVGAASYLGGQRFTRPSTLSSYLSWVQQLVQQQQGQQQGQQQEQQQGPQGQGHRLGRKTEQGAGGGSGQEEGRRAVAGRDQAETAAGAEGRDEAEAAAGAEGRDEAEAAAGAEGRDEAEAAAGPGPGSLAALGGQLEPPSEEDLMLDTIMLRLRTADGLDMRRFAQRFGRDAAVVLCKALERHERRGLVLRLPRLPEEVIEEGGAGAGAGAGQGLTCEGPGGVELGGRELACEGMQQGRGTEGSGGVSQAECTARGHGQGEGAALDGSRASRQGAATPKAAEAQGAGSGDGPQLVEGADGSDGSPSQHLESAQVPLPKGQQDSQQREGGAGDSAWDFRLRLADPQGFLLSNDIISDAFAAYSFK